MSRDTLFLLKGDFLDKGEGPFYCPECAQLQGVLSFYPKLKEQLNIRYVDFPRPRPEIVQELGEANQGCPTLVLVSANAGTLSGLNVGEHNGRKFLKGAADIGQYLARAYQVGAPH